jgi:hypothetical protein
MAPSDRIFHKVPDKAIWATGRLFLTLTLTPAGTYSGGEFHFKVHHMTEEGVTDWSVKYLGHKWPFFDRMSMIGIAIPEINKEGP